MPKKAKMGISSVGARYGKRENAKTFNSTTPKMFVKLIL